MEAMKEFTLWFFNNLPNFLLTEPISLLVGFYFAAFALGIIRGIVHFFIPDSRSDYPKGGF